MVSQIQSQPQQQQGLKVGGNLKINGPTMKTSNIAKIVFAIAAVAATVVFTATAILTANPLFFIGTAIALGVLLGVCGVHVHATVGYRRPLFVDPTFHRRPPVFVPPPPPVFVPPPPVFVAPPPVFVPPPPVFGRPRAPVFVPAPRPRGPVFVPAPRPRAPVFVPAPRPAPRPVPFGGPARGRPAVVPMRGPGRR